MTIQRLHSSPVRRRRQIGGAVALGLLGLAALAVGAASYWFVACPCERIPGSYLVGEAAADPVDEWSFANQVPLCQIQTNAGLLPHSINLNCMASDSGRLFLSCSQCEGKRWSSAALEQPAARIRLDGIVYPVTLRRVTTADELDLAWTSRMGKLQPNSGATEDSTPPRPDHWWSFEVTSRRQGAAD